MYIDFPDISPVIFSIGPFSFRWYAMAYLAGIVAAWLLTKRNIAKYNLGITNEQLDDLVFYTTLGIILGGRIGYVVCYGDGYFWKHPSEIIAVWHGGMSFHGGIAGVIVGYTALSHISSAIVRKMFAAFLLLSGIFSLIKSVKKE